MFTDWTIQILKLNQTFCLFMLIWWVLCCILRPNIRVSAHKHVGQKWGRTLKFFCFTMFPASCLWFIIIERGSRLPASLLKIVSSHLSLLWLSWGERMSFFLKLCFFGSLSKLNLLNCKRRMIGAVLLSTRRSLDSFLPLYCGGVLTVSNSFLLLWRTSEKSNLSGNALDLVTLPLTKAITVLHLVVTLARRRAYPLKLLLLLLC